MNVMGMSAHITGVKPPTVSVETPTGSWPSLALCGDRDQSGLCGIQSRNNLPLDVCDDVIGFVPVFSFRVLHVSRVCREECLILEVLQLLQHHHDHPGCSSAAHWQFFGYLTTTRTQYCDLYSCTALGLSQKVKGREDSGKNQNIDLKSPKPMTQSNTNNKN